MDTARGGGSAARLKRQATAGPRGIGELGEPTLMGPRSAANAEFERPRSPCVRFGVQPRAI